MIGADWTAKIEVHSWPGRHLINGTTRTSAGSVRIHLNIENLPRVVGHHAHRVIEAWVLVDLLSLPFGCAAVKGARGRLLHICFLTLIILNHFCFHHFFAKLRRRDLFASDLGRLVAAVHQALVGRVRPRIVYVRLALRLNHFQGRWSSPTETGRGRLVVQDLHVGRIYSLGFLVLV
jgi:hypothetical protein